MKRILILLLAMAATVRADYYNLNTGEYAKSLPGKIEVGGKVIASPSIKEASLIGWREVPEVKAEAGSQIVSVEYVQDTKDPLKVTAIVETKTDEVAAAETAAMEAAIAEANAAAAADRQKARDEITGAFADKAQAEAVGRIFDLLRGVP